VLRGPEAKQNWLSEAARVYKIEVRNKTPQGTHSSTQTAQTKEKTRMGGSPELGAMLYYKVVGSLLLVLAVLFLIAYGLKRWEHVMNKSTGGHRINILSRQPLSPKHTLLLVEVLDQTLLLGVSPEAIRLLTTLEKAAMSTEEPQPVAETPEPRRQFQALLRKFTNFHT
jgi:flagellar biosynthetic protein FliO